MSPSRLHTAISCYALLFFAGCSSPTLESKIDEAPGAPEDYNTRGTSITSIQHIDTRVIRTGTRFRDSEIGGISGIAYDPEAKVYHLLSDDRSEYGPARFFTAMIDAEKLQASADSIRFIKVTSLKKEDGIPFPKNSIDPEGIVIHPEGDFHISSEGDAKRGIAPFVNRFSADGRQTGQITVHQKYLPKKESGIRNNLAFESLTLTPDGASLVTATENGLIQDGPKADLDTQSISRIIVYDLPSATVRAEYAYQVDTVHKSPLIPGQFKTNGLVELLATDNDGTFLALERAYSTGRGTTVKLYEISTDNANDIQNIPQLADGKGRLLITDEELVSKTELLDFAIDLDIAPDNLEAMCFGPTLADGSRLMVVVSDNNFNKSQKTQLIFLKVHFVE